MAISGSVAGDKDLWICGRVAVCAELNVPLGIEICGRWDTRPSFPFLFRSNSAKRVFRRRVHLLIKSFLELTIGRTCRVCFTKAELLQVEDGDSR